MIQVSACRSHRFTKGIALYIDKFEGNKRFTVNDIHFDEVTELFKEAPPPVWLTDNAAQKLIDDLWDAGLRPSEGSGSAGCLVATQRHLKDMREITFNKLKMTMSEEIK